MQEPPTLLSKQYSGKKGVIYAFICQALGGAPKRIELEGVSPGYWTLIEKITELEGVSPLMYWQLQEKGWSAEIPGEVREWWTRSYYHNIAINTLLFQELERILVAFYEQDIPLMVLKGAALALYTYKDVGLRPMNDLDMLIPEHRVEEALERLVDLGYREAEEEITRGINRRILHNVYLRGGPGGLLGVELHWNLIAGEADDRAVSTEWFWEQIETGKAPSYFQDRDLEIPILCPTAHLLYLAAHLVLRHGGEAERLIWFYDIDQLVRSGRVNWELLIAQAEVLGWGALTRYTLEKASLFLDTSVPVGVLNRLADEEAWAIFLKQQRTAIGQLPRLKRVWKVLSHLDFRMRLRLLLALIFPSPAFLQWRYKPEPGWIWPVYYGYRWWTILLEHIRFVIPRGRK